MGLASACALGTGTMIGAGIFALSGEVAGAAGPAAVITYLLAGIVALLQALSVAELASARPLSGGPYLWVRDALGRDAGFVVGWQLWLGMVLSASFYAVGFARYLAYFLPWAPEGPAAAGLLAVLAALNAAGRQAGALLQNLSVAFLVFVLGGLVLAGIPRVDTAFWSPFSPYGWAPVLGAVPLVFVSYLGFDMVAQAGGAFHRPHVTLPVAMLVSVVLVTALYCGVVAVSTGIVFHVDLAQSPTPLAEVARRLVGRPGGLVVAAGGLVATLSSANGVFIAVSELGQAMVADGMLPRWLANVPARSPVAARSGHSSAAGPLEVFARVRAGRSHLLLGTLAGLVALVGGATGAIEQLARGTGLLHVLPFVLMPVALAAVRRSPSHRPAFRAPFGPVIPALAMGSMLVVLRQATAAEVVTAGGLTLLGLAWYMRERRPRLPGRPAGPGAWLAGGPDARSRSQTPGLPGAGAWGRRPR